MDRQTFVSQASIVALLAPCSPGHPPQRAKAAKECAERLADELGIPPYEEGGKPVNVLDVQLLESEVKDLEASKAKLTEMFNSSQETIRARDAQISELQEKIAELAAKEVVPVVPAPVTVPAVVDPSPDKSKGE